MFSKNFFLLLSLSTSTFVFAGNTGAGSGGGGESIAAQYSRVSQNTLNAVKIICHSNDNQDQEQVSACAYLASLQLAINSMKVAPRTRNTVLGQDKQPRDAGNDGAQTVFLDVDRWSDKQNESNLNNLLEARTKQVLIALHEPLVLAGAETNDQYVISNKLVDLLNVNNFDLNKIVGKPSVLSINFIYKTFEGSGRGQGDGVTGYDAAEAEAEAKAQSEGFGDCIRTKTWYIEHYRFIPIPYTTDYVQVKCSKPVENK